MRIFDRYIIQRIFAGYLFILLVFVGLYFIIDTFINLSDILENKPPLSILVQYYLYSLPVILLRVSPFSLLISVLYSLGELNRNNEILSIRTAGSSITRLVLPIIVLVLFISVSLLFLQEKVLIYSQQKVEDIKSHSLKKKTPRTSEVRKLAFTSGKMIFFVGKFLPKEKTLYNVIIFKRNKEGNVIKKVLSPQITYEYGFWIGKDVVEYEHDINGKIQDTPTFKAKKKIKLELTPSELLLKKSILLEFTSLKDLRQEIETLKKVKASEKLSQLTVTFHQKIAEPFAHLFLILGVLPLAMEVKKRKVGLSSLGTGFIFFFVYLVLSSFSIALGKSGVLLPSLSAWVAPIFFLTVGLTSLSIIR